MCYVYLMHISAYLKVLTVFSQELNPVCVCEIWHGILMNIGSTEVIPDVLGNNESAVDHVHVQNVWFP